MAQDLNSQVGDVLDNYNRDTIDKITNHIIDDDDFYSPHQKEFISFLLMRCIVYHKDTKRESGNFYAVHVIETARIADRASRVSGKVGDPIVIGAALLHDAIEERVDRLYHDRIEEYYEKINELFESTRKSLKDTVGNFHLYSNFEEGIESLVNICEKLTRKPDVDYYKYIRGFFFDKKMKNQDVERAIIAKLSDRIHNTSDLGVFSDLHKNYSIYKNLYIIDTTKEKLKKPDELTANTITIMALDLKLKEVSLRVLDEMIEKIESQLSEKDIKKTKNELIDYTATKNFSKLTRTYVDEVIKEEDKWEECYVYDGTLYSFDNRLHTKKIIRKKEGNILQNYRDALLMRALIWSYVLNPVFRIKGFDKIGENENGL